MTAIIKINTEYTYVKVENLKKTLGGPKENLKHEIKMQETGLK